MNLRAPLPFARCCMVIVGVSACYQAPAGLGADFANSVLVLSSPNLLGQNGVGVQVVLQDSRGKAIRDSVVQLEAEGCDLTQPTAPTGEQGATAGSILAAPAGQHVVSATVTVGSMQVTLPLTTTLNALNAVADDPNAVQAGVPLNMQAVALLDKGTVDSAYTGTLHFESTDAAATLPDDAPMPAEAKGVLVSVGGIILRTTGLQTVTITDAATGASLASEKFSVVPGPIARLAFTDYPSVTTVGVPFKAKVQAQIPSGAVLQSYTASVSFNSTDANARLPQATSFEPKDAGVIEVTLALTRVGGQSIMVTDGVSVGTIHVTAMPGPAVSYALTGLPVPATAFAPYSLQVTAVDSFGNTASGYTGAVTFTSTDIQAVLPADLTLRATDAGSAAAGKVALTAFGNVGLTATDKANPAITGTLTVLTHRVVAVSRQNSVTEGLESTCFRIDAGNLKCTGANGSGQLGYGDTAPRGTLASQMGTSLPYLNLGAGKTAKVVTAGAQHICALLQDGSVKCWGDNARGQLGVGDTQTRGHAAGTMGDALPAAKLGGNSTAVLGVAAGAAHTCVVTSNHQVYCWGANDYGQLGYGDTQQRGDTLASMGSGLPPVSLGTGRTAAFVFAGAYHTCVLLDSQQALCWGYNASGQLGLGDTDNRGDQPNEMGDNLPQLDMGAGLNPISIVAGGYHNCANIGGGNFKCWGDNAVGQLGLGDTLNRGDAPGAMGDALPIISIGSLGQIRSISSGIRSSCALLLGGATKCWGQNNRGQLGMGDLLDRGGTPGTIGTNLPAVDVGVGRTSLFTTTSLDHTCTLSDIGFVKCWGDNSYGQLANGSNGNIGTSAIQMGDSLAPVYLW